MHLRKDPLRASARLVDALGAHCSKPPRSLSSTAAAAAHSALLWAHGRTHPTVRDWVSSTSQLLPATTQAWFQQRWLQVAQAATQPYLVCTVGALSIWPGVSNVIPGGVNFTVDIRSDSDGKREEVEQWLQQKVASECGTLGTHCSVVRLHSAGTQHADMDVRDALTAAAGRVAKGERTCCEGGAARAAEGADSTTQPRRMPPVLTSGAGHDALAIAAADVPMGMLFVRCRGGVSHSPDEFVLPEDVTAATHVLLEYLLKASSE